MVTDLLVTDPEQRVLTAIRILKESRDGQAPTKRELAAYLDLSPTRIGQILDSLEEHGFIRREAKKARALFLTDKAAA